MAGIQAEGIGSGLDIATLVKQLVAAERQPHDARLARRESASNLQLSALGALKGAMSAVRDSLASLKSLALFSARSVASSDATILAGSATADVQPGTYDIEVVNLASAHKLASAAFVDGRTAVVGTGTLTLSLGASSFDVEIADGAATLADIRDAINSAPGNAGISASILNEAGGSRLILTARSTGAQNVIGVAQSGGDGGLAALVYDPLDPGGSALEQKSPAADALVRINGFDFNSPTDTVTGAVDGLTINLKKADPGTSHTLTVANDTGTVNARIRKLVGDYNNLAKVVRDLQRYDAATGKAGALIGDAFVRGLESQMRRDLSDPVAGAAEGVSTLAAVGIRTQADGTLQVDDTVLNAALAADFDGVARLFAGVEGVAQRLHGRLDASLASDAQLASRTTTLNDTIRKIATERDTVDRRMESVRARYQAQFSALDRLLVQMQTTSNYLSQQLSALNKTTG